MKKCPACAEEIQDAAVKCKHCGEFLNRKSRLTYIILGFFLGCFGVHDFYAGHNKSAIALFSATAGCLALFTAIPSLGLIGCLLLINLVVIAELILNTKDGHGQEFKWDSFE